MINGGLVPPFKYYVLNKINYSGGMEK